MNVRPRVLITRRVFPAAVDRLRERFDLDYHDSYEILDRGALIERIRDKQAVISQVTDTFPAEVLEAAPRLKVVANVAVGFDNVDVATATARGVAVTHTPDVLTNTTADLAFALLAAAARRLNEAERLVRAGRWDGWRVDLLCGHDVYGKTLGIIGAGRIGQAMARRGAGFDMPVLYYNRRRLAPETERSLRAEYVPLDELLRQSDFISLHVPLTPATRRLIGAAEFRVMKPSAILVNTARGEVVDETALVAALTEGRLAGAGLDVFENEPRVRPDLSRLENVVLTPHIGSASTATREIMCRMAADGVAAVLSGRRPAHLVNPDIGAVRERSSEERRAAIGY